MLLIAHQQRTAGRGRSTEQPELQSAAAVELADARSRLNFTAQSWPQR